MPARLIALIAASFATRRHYLMLLDAA